MHLPNLLQSRIKDALQPLTQNADDFAGMIRSTNDPKFGDYQCNAAMPLAKILEGANPRDVARQLIDHLQVEDICDAPEIAGPGFINLKVKDDWLAEQMIRVLADDRCGVVLVESPSTIIVDFSSPNVAKPMHVGHIRSTVIGDALARTLSFLGHHVVTDNHLGDWGTQFGIIIYGYKNFGDPDTVSANPVPELAKLYRLVNQISEYQKAVAGVDPLESQITVLRDEVEAANAAAMQTDGDAKEHKQRKKAAATSQRRLSSAVDKLSALKEKIAGVESDASVLELSRQHPSIAHQCLQETAKLHEGDAENRELWTRFLPHCKDEINRIYDRLSVTFDHTLGESFYHDMLATVVDDLTQNGYAKESEGAICVFLDDFEAPMIIRKKDGAFLYATTDLATLKYRRDQFSPDEILYVVDTRQGEHFEKLFAVAHATGLDDIKLVHVNFGTVLGADGKPLKTRSGTLIGLESLLDDAVRRAMEVACDPERVAQMDPPMSDDEQKTVAETVGIGAIKFADLSHQRTSDYRFNVDKMVALEGNTATYIQYSFARTQSILRRMDVAENDVQKLIADAKIAFVHPRERTLALRLLQFEESLASMHRDYAPNHLTDYLFETAKAYAGFNEDCPVMKAENEDVRATRVLLVVLCGRVLQKGLDLLGIGVIPRM